MGLRDYRDDRREIDIIGFLEDSVVIALEACRRLCAAVLLEIGEGYVVDFHERCFGARLHAEVADGDAVAHGKVFHAVADKFHSVIVGAVGSDHADDGQDQVSRGDAVSELTGEIEAQRLGDHDPGAARHHTVEVVCAADAGSEGAQSAVSAGVAVSAEDELARNHMLLAHDLVTYAFSFVEGYAVISGKIAHLLL